jgi:glycosyltransferase involved in cell wall biosynthesis
MAVTDMTQDVQSGLESGYSGNGQRRLMFVIEALTVGGAEQMVVDLANEFAQRGDYVHVVCLTELGDLAVSLSPNINVSLFNKRRGVDLRVVKMLRALILEHNIHVVNSHLWTANLWTRIALYRSGIPVVVTEHNRDVWKKAHNRLIDRILSYATAKLIAVSEDTANYYKSVVGVRESLITVVNNGIDTARYASGSGARLRETLADDGEFLVGSVGRLAIAKNHPRLVKAAHMLKQSGIPVQVVIAGEGPERSATEAAITQHGVSDCVKLMGARNDIPDLLAALDVFVLSSDREGHPLSALEAQAAGTPVVLTNAGGSADAISKSASGRGGMLVECNASAIAESLRYLATHPEELQAMAEFAKSHAARCFDKSSMINKYSAIFNAVRPTIESASP